MIPVLKELKILMEIHGLSPAEIAKYISVSEKTAYNWLSYESSSPRPIYLERIRRAIRKIRREFEGDFFNQAVKKYYRAVEPHLSAEEKFDLLEIVSESGGALQSRYLERLKALAEKYNVKVSK